MAKRGSAGRFVSKWWHLMTGIGALLWFVFRTGAKPSRFRYPCQQASLAAAWLTLATPLAAGWLALRKRTRLSWRRAGVVGAVTLLSLGLWGYASRRPVFQGPLHRAAPTYRASLYHVSNCPQTPTSDRFPGLDCLLNLMGQNGLKFHQSATVTQTSGPAGIVAANDVVLIKINYQWTERGGTNVDLLQGLVRFIVDHPDGFAGEVVICENTQFNSSDGFDRQVNNAEDHTFSPFDVVAHFRSLGYRVSLAPWDLIQYTGVSEYSSGDMADGYVVYPYDSRFSGRISYPKFQTTDGTYVSVKNGVWNPGSASYDRSRLKFINVPVFKSHSADYGATACVKHYMGVVTGDLSTNSHNAIGAGIMGALLGEIQPADLNILDCIWVNANPYDGPWTGYADATRRDELVASLDPVAADIWSVKNILIPAFLANGYSPPWPTPSADPDDPTSEFRTYLDASMSYLNAAGYNATNDLTQIDAYSLACGSGGGTTVMPVTGPGPAGANPPQVKTWDIPISTAATWNAYGTVQAGVNVAGASIDGSGPWEVLSGPGPGPAFGPQVRGFDRSGNAVTPSVNFYAYGTLRYGAHPERGDVDQDGYHEILTSPGPGAVFGPHIRGFDYDGGPLSAMPGISFFAYGTLRYGARTAGGDIDADGYDEIVSGAGAGAIFLPHVRAFDFDGGPLGSMPISLFAFATGDHGAAVTSGDTDGDGRDELVAAHGPDATQDSEVRGFVFNGKVTSAFSFVPFTVGGGTEIAAGDLDTDGQDELLAGMGWGQASPTGVDAFDIAGGTGTAMPGMAFTAYTGLSYGTKVGISGTGAP